ncbi:helix-turn-helix domain-containing protein [Actinotignum urinale]|uniref:helix-turn-helix domain-containing protein n=1 Tax=Actinotignum urinale TaxID=190146 RepID=UPI0003B3BEF4|nr:helix-turn-helix domain-containing protein [Actinotignum urinale]MDY5159499.1 hypothetical protein [Actinotignum urinale]MDY5161006.1 hypothetical protein [Actinotignum urinale]
MSFKAVAWALDDVTWLDAEETLVLVALAESSNDEHVAWRTIKSLAQRARCSVSRARRHVATLKNYGLISRPVRDAWRDGETSTRMDSLSCRYNTGSFYQLNVDVVEPPEGEEDTSTLTVGDGRGEGRGKRASHHGSGGTRDATGTTGSVKETVGDSEPVENATDSMASVDNGNDTANTDDGKVNMGNDSDGEKTAADTATSSTVADTVEDTDTDVSNEGSSTDDEDTGESKEDKLVDFLHACLPDKLYELSRDEPHAIAKALRKLTGAGMKPHHIREQLRGKHFNPVTVDNNTAYLISFIKKITVPHHVTQSGKTTGEVVDSHQSAETMSDDTNTSTGSDTSSRDGDGRDTMSDPKRVRTTLKQIYYGEGGLSVEEQRKYVNNTAQLMDKEGYKELQPLWDAAFERVCSSQ